MFPLHDRTRRKLCRAVFVIVGVIPTVAVAAWCASINSTAHLASVHARLQNSLGLEVRLDQVTHPRPGVTLLHGLELIDPQTGAVLLKARSVEIDDHQPVRNFVLSQPEIELTSLSAWRQLIDDHLRRRIDGNQPILRFAATELMLRWPESNQTLVDCGAKLETVENRNTLTAAFRLPESKSPEPLSIRVERAMGNGSNSDSFEFQTAGTPLPCSLLAAVLHRENRLGDKSQLRGVVRGAATPTVWDGAFEGRFENIDLRAAISDQFPHQLAGEANVVIQSAQIHDGRLEQCEGAIHAGPGAIGASLLWAASQMLGMRVPQFQIQPSPSIAYDELNAAFTLDTRGLSIRGQCAGAEKGVVVRSQSSWLLLDQPASRVPVVNLVRMLVPDGRLQVPATRQTDWLLQMLPLPDVDLRK